jgi:NADPH:quinone reductase-like Zn-dependent oxidoreductase
MRMKAIVQDVYGSADVLQYADVDKPVPGDNDVLIRVRAASLHIGDWHVMTGLPYMLRVIGFGLRVPKVRVRGIDVAGTVESVGRNVTAFKAGDEVFGTCEGAFADFACAPAGNLALKPANLTFDQAAAIPTSSFAALQALRDCGQVKSGDKVLIIGATGGVGMFAVQVAKALGAEVTGVCSAANMDRVRKLGADHVIDYATEDFADGARRYDIIVETGGNRPLSELRRALTPRGHLVLVGGEGGNSVLGTTGKWIHAAMLSPMVKQTLRSLATKPNQADLQVIRGLIESGKLTPVIDRAFPLSATADAFRYLKTSRGRGKIVISDMFTAT